MAKHTTPQAGFQPIEVTPVTPVGFTPIEVKPVAAQLAAVTPGRPASTPKPAVPAENKEA